MRFVGVILTALLFLPSHSNGRTQKDTIYTTDGDRIILTYEITNSANQTAIRFTGQQKKLGRLNAKYKDLSKVAVMFFDRVGNYGNDVSITNMIPEAFMTPPDVQFSKSRDGYYLVQAEPSLVFNVKSETEIHIPIYLAYKPKKGKYILFSKSMDLKIPLGAKRNVEKSRVKSQTIEQTITSTTEIEADNTATIKVLESINIAKDLITQATALPFSDNLLDEINYLRQKRREITDKALVEEITDVMNRFEAKKQSLEEKTSAELQARQREEMLRAEKEAQKIKAENDSIATAQQKASEEEKKRNLWLIAGGVVLAILAFIGNQVFQGIRNKKNQMRMMSMQQNIADRAEAEAKRRARNAVRSQKNRIINKAKQETSTAIRKKVTIKTNGKSRKTSI